MAKVHMLISADPVNNGEDRVALCGELIQKASAVPLADMPESQSTILLCKKCFSKNYFYVISEGQEALDLERAS